MNEIYTERAFICPSCNKQRLYRQCNHVVSDEQKEVETPRGDKIMIYVDCCEYCKHRIMKKHFKTRKADAKKILDAVETQTTIDEDSSLEDLL